MKKSNSVRNCKNLVDGRPGVRLQGDWGHVSVLLGGGHICELVSNRHDRLNPLWRPPWKTIEPYEFSPSRHKRAYGPPPEARVLSGIAGHSLSFDHFGPPSDEETKAGQSTHGEAPVVEWKRQKVSAPEMPSLVYGCTLPEAQIRFRRTIKIDKQNPVVYCEESALNLGSFDRPISWTEHVTYGPPFLEPGVTMFDIPAVTSKVAAAKYSPDIALKPDAEFLWPLAPNKAGGNSDLRTTREGRFENYSAQLLDRRQEFGFTAACNPRLRLLVVYVFRRSDFPWVGNWEEQYSLAHAPWKNRTFCRGIEFSTTPFAIPRRETVEQNRLFGTVLYRWLYAKSEIKLRFMTLLFDVPADFAGVSGISVTAENLRVRERGEKARELVAAIKPFLNV